MSKFLHDNDDAKALEIRQVFSENSQAKYFLHVYCAWSSCNFFYLWVKKLVYVPTDKGVK